MKIYLDDEGNVTSTPTGDAVTQLDPEMANLLRHDDEGLAVEKLPGGGEFLNTAGRYGDVMVMRVDANGKKVICQNDADKIINGLNDTTPTGPEVK